MLCECSLMVFSHHTFLFQALLWQPAVHRCSLTMVGPGGAWRGLVVPGGAWRGLVVPGGAWWGLVGQDSCAPQAPCKCQSGSRSVGGDGGQGLQAAPRTEAIGVLLLGPCSSRPQCPRLAQDCCLDRRTEALRFCTQQCYGLLTNRRVHTQLDEGPETP